MKKVRLSVSVYLILFSMNSFSLPKFLMKQCQYDCVTNDAEEGLHAFHVTDPWRPFWHHCDNSYHTNGGAGVSGGTSCHKTDEIVGIPSASIGVAFDEPSGEIIFGDSATEITCGSGLTLNDINQGVDQTSLSLCSFQYDYGAKTLEVIENISGSQIQIPFGN